jgi:hypothetical protein
MRDGENYTPWRFGVILLSSENFWIPRNQSGGQGFKSLVKPGCGEFAGCEVWLNSFQVARGCYELYTDEEKQQASCSSEQLANDMLSGGGASLHSPSQSSSVVQAEVSDLRDWERPHRSSYHMTPWDSNLRTCH